MSTYKIVNHKRLKFRTCDVKIYHKIQKLVQVQEEEKEAEEEQENRSNRFEQLRSWWPEETEEPGKIQVGSVT